MIDATLTRSRWVAVAFAATCALFMSHSLSQADTAQADSCSFGTVWSCGWPTPPEWIAPATPRYFQAENTLRNWMEAQVSDVHGGTVAQKCVHIKRGSDGYTEQIVCGSGYPGLKPIPSYMRPGYVFVRHGASGARTIQGGAWHY